MDLKLNDWESFLYESKPYAYAALGVYALSVEHPNILIMALAGVLIFCGILVLRMRYAHRKGASLESLFYESLPFIYLGIGVYGLAFLNISKLGIGSGVILLFCSTKVFQWRVQYRRAVAAHISTSTPAHKKELAKRAKKIS